MLAALGAGGVGLVWGWLLGGLEGSARRSPGRTLAAGALATLAVGVVTNGLAGGVGTALGAGTTTLAMLAHLVWLQELREYVRRQT